MNQWFYFFHLNFWPILLGYRSTFCYKMDVFFEPNWNGVFSCFYMFVTTIKDLRGVGLFNDEIHSLHSNENCRGICPFYGENKGAKPFESFNSLFSGSSRRTNWERDDVHPASFSWEIRILLPSVKDIKYQFCMTLIKNYWP